MRTGWFGLLVAGVAFAVGAPGVSGQSLHLAELFAEQGRLDDARAEVRAWFEIRGLEASPSELQHGRWLRARFAVDPREGEADLEALVREHPTGPFTDRALVWLGAFAADRGETRRAVDLYSTVLRDFPESTRRAEARDWLVGQGIDVAPFEEQTARPASVPAVPVRVVESPDSMPTRVAALPDSTPTEAVEVPDSVPARAAEVPDSVPTRTAEVADSVPTQPAEVPDSVPAEAVEVEAPDSTSAPAAAAPDSTPAQAADSTPAPPEDTPDEPAPERPRGPMEGVPHGPPYPGAAEGGRWAVQIGAFRNPDGAAGLVSELRDADFDARLVQVPLNDLLRVRIGRFADSDAALAELGRLREAGYDGGVVNDARDETVVER